MLQPLQIDHKSGVRVRCDVRGLPVRLCANFSLHRPPPLCSRLRPDVRDRQSSGRSQTDIRRASSLNAPYSTGWAYKNASANHSVFPQINFENTATIFRSDLTTQKIISFSLCRFSNSFMGLLFELAYPRSTLTYTFMTFSVLSDTF